MDEMNTSLVNLKHSLLRLTGVPEKKFNQQQCSMTANTDNILIDTQPFPLRGSRQIMNSSTEGRQHTENAIHRQRNWRTDININKGLSVRKK